jgi:hypothetical protein
MTNLVATAQIVLRRRACLADAPLIKAFAGRGFGKRSPVTTQTLRRRTSGSPGAS